jgi:hypothetical protein
MRKFILAAALTVLSFPAFACDCSNTNADTVLANPAISVVDVTVRGYNTHNAQSMLEINNVRHGGLVARNIRARFTTDSCGTIPNQKQMTLLVHNDEDGRYSIAGKCETQAVLNSLKGQ